LKKNEYKNVGVKLVELALGARTCWDDYKGWRRERSCAAACALGGVAEKHRRGGYDSNSGRTVCVWNVTKIAGHRGETIGREAGSGLG